MVAPGSLEAYLAVFQGIFAGPDLALSQGTR